MASNNVRDYGTKIEAFDLTLSSNNTSLANPESGNNFGDTDLSRINFPASQSRGVSLAGEDITMAGMGAYHADGFMVENRYSKVVYSNNYPAHGCSYDFNPNYSTMTYGNASNYTLVYGKPPNISVQNSNLTCGTAPINAADSNLSYGYQSLVHNSHELYALSYSKNDYLQQAHVPNTHGANGQHGSYVNPTRAMGQVQLYGDNDQYEDIFMEPRITGEQVITFNKEVAKIKQDFARIYGPVKGLSVKFPGVSTQTTFKVFARICLKARESVKILEFHYQEAHQEYITKLNGTQIGTTVFRFFDQLPVELRLKIWKLFDKGAVSNRVVHHHAVRAIRHSGSTILQFPHPTHEALLSINRETRNEMLKANEEGYSKALVSDRGALVIRPGDKLLFMGLSLYTKMPPHGNFKNAFAPFKLVSTLSIDQNTLLQGAQGGSMGCIRQNLLCLLNHFPAMKSLVLYGQGDSLPNGLLRERIRLRAGKAGAGTTRWMVYGYSKLRQNMMDEITRLKNEAGQGSRLKDLWVEFGRFALYPCDY